MTQPSQQTPYPSQWANLGQEFDPQQHLMQIERFDKKTQKKVSTDYLNVQNRLIWFIRDQRMLISAGLAQTAYVIQTEMVEHDREGGWAHFKTYVRDVLGNEATMYGSESVRDFPDYIEKASTKSLGRALLLLGYGTAFTSEIDEGDRVVDAPAPSATKSNSISAAKPALPTAQTRAEPVAQTGATANATMQRIEEWGREHGVSGETVKAFCNRKQFSSKNMDHMKKLLDIMNDEQESATILVMQLAVKHMTTLEVISRVMREQKIQSFADFWRAYQANPDDWAMWLADYLKQKASA